MSKDESRVIISPGLLYAALNHAVYRHSCPAVFLVDFSAESFVNLTEQNCDNHRWTDYDFSTRYFAPTWHDDYSINLVRVSLDENDYLWLHLVNLNTTSGVHTVLANLTFYQYPGRLALVWDYTIHDETVYFSVENFGASLLGLSEGGLNMLEASGFFSAPLDGGQTAPVQLLSLEDINHPEGAVALRRIAQVEVSPDGRWALLTADNMQFIFRDNTPCRF